LEGISLESPIRTSSIYSDLNVADFNDSVQAGAAAARDRLEDEERGYTYDIYREIFNIDQICSNLGWLRKIWGEKLQGIYESEYISLLKWGQTTDQAKKTAETFRAQVSRIEAAKMEDDSFLNERLNKAAGYFHPILDELRGFCIKLGNLEVDNKEVGKRLKEALDELLTGLEISCSAMEMLKDGKFTLKDYNKSKTECLLEDRSKVKARRLKKLVKADDEPGVVNEELREKLQEWRTARFKKDNIPAYMIMHQSTLMAIASRVPKTKAELMRIKGFGEESFKKYGEEILAITIEF
jgi:superfamily II DNA helicase RecQ